jgi:hypothetical protein
MRQRLRLATSASPDTGRAVEEERSRLAATLDQLERAELYVVAALDLQSDDRDRRRLIEDLRAQIVAVRRALARPTLVG